MLRRVSVADSQFEIIGPQIDCSAGLSAMRNVTRGSNVRNDFVPSFSDSVDSMHDALDRNRGSFAAAYAERSNAALQIVGLQRMQQRHDQPRAGRADGMAECAGAAVDVELVSGNAEVLLRGHRDHGKGLVDLEQ